MTTDQSATQKIVPHCWKGRTEEAEERFGMASHEWAEAFNLPSATCMLMHGHEGPHEFVDDREIGVTFK